jgi:hypothetical protein
MRQLQTKLPRTAAIEMKLLKPFHRRVNKVIAAAEINGSSKTAQGSELLTVKLIYCPRMKLIEANDQKETSSSAVSQLPRCLGRRNQSPSTWRKNKIPAWS